MSYQIVRLPKSTPPPCRRDRQVFPPPAMRLQFCPSMRQRLQDMKTRDEALALLHQYTKTDSLRKHALAVEQAMKACARRFAPDEDAVRWGMAGLLHDFDYEQFPNADQHPWVGSKILAEAGFDDDLRRAIMGHAPYTGVPRETMMARALFACDELCGFLTACALVQPSKALT